MVHWLCKLLLIRRQESKRLQSILNVSASGEEGRFALNLSEELNTVKAGFYSGVMGGGKVPTAKKPEPGYKGDILVGLIDVIHTQHLP